VNRETRNDEQTDKRRHEADGLFGLNYRGA